MKLSPTSESVDPAWAWEPYEPSKSRPWTAELAAHLYRRAAFGASWRELQAAVAAGPKASLELLLNGTGKTEVAATGEFYNAARSTIAALLGLGGDDDLPAWWLYLMIHSPRPALEKLTLFWHGHFATSAAKVTDPSLMLAQNELLRKHAFGEFRTLLRGITRDTAMLLWLDSATNRKNRPNENFAREVMELFALGVGNYTERDIKEAARCFTGWEVHNNRFWVNAAQHDGGEKSVLGARGEFDGDGLIDVLLRQPAAAKFLVRKLFRFYVADELEGGAAGDALLEPLVDDLRKHDYDVGRLLRRMLASNYFFSPHSLLRRIKSPVEFAVGLVRALEGHTDHYALTADLTSLGQRVFYPPNVKGWNGGREWINAHSVLSRINLAGALVAADGRYAGKFGLAKSPAIQGISDDAALVRRLIELLLTTEPKPTIVDGLTAAAQRRDKEDDAARLARTVQAIASLPEFQLC
jgi:hypothetical protein